MITKITKDLYVSSSREANDKEILKELGIKTIINVQKRTKDEKVVQARRKWFPMSDGHVTEEQVWKVLNYIKKRKKMKKIPILVHCSAGKNRSVSMIAAYLVISKKFDSLQKAVTFIKKLHRPTGPRKDLLKKVENTIKKKGKTYE